MITAWLPAEKGLHPHPIADGIIPERSVWLDVNDLTDEDEILLERTLGIDVPSRAEMQAIEASSRLYREDGAVFMTATMLLKTETHTPETTAVTFILVKEQLITLRYAEPWTFRIFAKRAPKSCLSKADLAFVTLLEITIERLADMLELVSLELEHVSRKIFVKRESGHVDLQQTLMNLGHSGNIISKVRESLVDKNRLVIFLGQSGDRLVCAEGRVRMEAIHRDLHSLSDQASFISGKIAFLLDATLGLINIEQNRIIKIFSIVAVIFMPPTMIASIYGMNFGETRMPELTWRYGYEYALGLMAASVAMTLWYFKRRRWM
jgi:magnesium transporter